MITKEQMRIIQDIMFEELKALRSAGQREYAGGDNALGNFERLATQLQISREKVLWTYLVKHLDGIIAHINGHISQREPVEGRINDAIVYLMLLRGMVEDNKSKVIPPPSSRV